MVSTEYDIHSIFATKCLISAIALLNESDSRINTPEFSQTCTTALQIGIVDLIKTFGINPRAVIGHSSGEISAA